MKEGTNKYKYQLVSVLPVQKVFLSRKSIVHFVELE